MEEKREEAACTENAAAWSILWLASIRNAGLSHAPCPRTFCLTNSTVSLSPNLIKTSSYLLPSGDISWIEARYPCLLANPAKPRVTEPVEWKSLSQI